MAGFFATPPTLEGKLLTTVPKSLYAEGTSDWSPGNGPLPPIFLEGITTDTQGNLWVVDIGHGRILRFDLTGERKAATQFDSTGEWKAATQFQGNPNGLAIARDGRIMIADYAEGILAYDPTSGVAPHLARRNLERFKGPNDLIVGRNGDLYFTDQGQTDMADPTGRVYRLSETGKLDMLIGNGPSPNGLVLSPDESILYVAMTRDNSVWRCPLHKDGTTTKVARFFSTNGSTGPDGLTVDVEGNLFICMPPLGAIFVISPLGEPVARIIAPKTDKSAMLTNCIFGSRPTDRKRLYFCDSLAGAVGYIDWHCEGGTPLRSTKE
ncbi:hypothetical protein CcaverHIS002_0307350 [Cutaneotrichosporon cavernicola]|nr:hypothetical protein CcaverHIS002_0307350 [Cutaneotrichosporon cavernicola]